MKHKKAHRELINPIHQKNELLILLRKYHETEVKALEKAIESMRTFPEDAVKRVNEIAKGNYKDAVNHWRGIFEGAIEGTIKGHLNVDYPSMKLKQSAELENERLLHQPFN